ncbi:MAG: hypothetical protein H6799_02415 [Candidatus Nomurabacteria bacterium]|nr:MAG: hypothetical protein H6799_02415 [Candidatus Nomurabacteria bacterium]HRV75852.1 hypothetical protein [Candidatus Saccharimonadales bacterium]
MTDLETVSTFQNQYAIGRVGRDVWCAEAIGRFTQELPSGLHIALIDAPAVRYVPDKDLAPHLPDTTDEERGELFKASTQAVLDHLTNTGKLGGIASTGYIDPSDASLSFFTHPDTGKIRMDIKLRDIETSMYPAGHLMEGEKTAIRDMLGLPTTFRQSHPYQKLKFAAFAGDLELFDQAVIDRLRRALPSGVVLGPVGPVTIKPKEG